MQPKAKPTKAQIAYQEKRAQQAAEARPAKPEPGKHNRKAGRLRRAGPGGGVRKPCPIAKQKMPNAKQQARIQQITERLASIGALPAAHECEAGSLVGSSKGAKRRRKKARETTTATPAVLQPPGTGAVVEVAACVNVSADGEDDMFAMGLPLPLQQQSAMPTQSKAMPAKAPSRTSPAKTVETIEAKSQAKYSSEKIEELRSLQSLFQDQQLNCRDCGSQFVFSERQQQALWNRGFKGLKKTRCDDCAKYKKNRFSARGSAR